MAEPTVSNYVGGAALDNSTSLGGDQVNIKSFTLASNIDSVVTSIPATVTITGVTAPFYLLADSELIYVEGISGSNFTPVVRGAGGTTAASHTSGITLFVVYAANLFNQLKRAIIATQTELGINPSGSEATVVSRLDRLDTVQTNYLINGGFDFAQRQTPGTLTNIADNAYGPDRWRSTRENADVQYVRNGAISETGLTSRFHGQYKKITSAGKFHIIQIIEGINSVPLRGKVVSFQIKMKASSSKTIRMAVIELQSGGTMDAIPAAFVTAFNADTVDPTLGTNLSVISAAQSKAVTTAWQSFNVSITVPSNSLNIIAAIWTDSDFAVNDTLSVAEAGLFVSNTTQPWTPIPTQQELALCQRYYWKSFGIDVAPAQNAGFVGCLRFIAGKVGATAQFSPTYKLPVPMRVTPTLVFFNTSAANGEVRDATAAADCSATTAPAVADANSMAVNCTGAAGTAVGNSLTVHVTAEAEL